MEESRQRDVSLIVSPYDSATTAWVVHSASTIERVIDTWDSASVNPDMRIDDLRRKIAALTAPAFMVVNEEGALIGVLSKSDILKPVKTRLVLVDHNEMTCCLGSGAELVTITEIIDHHRLGVQRPTPSSQSSSSTKLRWGSTCTIVADLSGAENSSRAPDLVLAS